jgi:uncharacterized membrane protein
MKTLWFAFLKRLMLDSIGEEMAKLSTAYEGVESWGRELEGFMVRDQNPQHWKLLVFYYNPENPRLFVAKRTGIPFTVNFARPTAWVMTVPVVAGMVLAAIVNNR